MIAKPKYKDHQDENDRDDGEHIRREKALDEALKNTFPASDPVSVEQPMVPTVRTTVEVTSGHHWRMNVSSSHPARDVSPKQPNEPNHDRLTFECATTPKRTS
jgi:hypothetical protein